LQGKRSACWSQAWQATRLPYNSSTMLALPRERFILSPPENLRD